MNKIIFDASIHLGQFCITSEDIRIASKNSQTAISTRPQEEIVGVITFNENSWIDHVIWALEREQQDTFYKLMDVFHTVKNIDRIELTTQDAKLALEIVEKINLDISNALTCAVAVSKNIDFIHTNYKSLLNDSVVSYIKDTYNIDITSSLIGEEKKFPEESLETYYQDALEIFKKSNINLIDRLHK